MPRADELDERFRVDVVDVRFCRHGLLAVIKAEGINV